jgi:hypothetical protein
MSHSFFLHDLTAAVNDSTEFSTLVTGGGGLIRRYAPKDFDGVCKRAI